MRALHVGLDSSVRTSTRPAPSEIDLAKLAFEGFAHNEAGRRKNGWAEERMNGWKEERIDRRTDGQTNGWMEGTKNNEI